MQKRLYNLDGLRFLAAWIVLISHIEVLKPYFGIEVYPGRFSMNGAQLAVSFFFVLSGFLIAWLLLREKKQDAHQKIRIGRFYQKRICRIWPLYYALVLLVFFVLRNSRLFEGLHEDLSPTDTGFPIRRFVGYILFLPNTTEINYGKEVCLGQTWSLGVEEFFYLFFPLIVYFTPLAKMRKVLFFILISFLTVSIGIYFVKNENSDTRVGLLSIYLDRYRIYAFAAGAIAASWMDITGRENRVQQILKKKSTAVILFIVTAILVIMGITFSMATQQVYSLLFALLIYSLTVSEIRIPLLNHPLPVYLGKISYGIYMLHPLVLVVLLKIWHPASGGLAISIGLVAAGTILTILLAAFSYECFEKYFLRLARRRKKESFNG